MVLVGLEVHMRAWTDNGLADCSEGLGRPAMRISGKSYLPTAQGRFFTVEAMRHIARCLVIRAIVRL